MTAQVHPSKAESASGSFHITTLGCSKNRVDSDGMEHLLQQRGMHHVGKPTDAQVLIVNTCGFLGAARQESIGAIDELLKDRRDDQVIIAAGCLPALGNYSADIPEGVDRILTTREWYRIGSVVGELLGEPEPEDSAGCEGLLTTFRRSEAGPSAYLKVADGCDHNCHFCTIPSIKGRQVSKRPLHVIQEVVDLVAGGTKEVVLVAQDTIRYGADIGMKHGLPQLLEMVAEQVPNLPWLRMLYIYPSPLTLRMVDVMAEHDMLLPYLDMPLQHSDRTVLRSMNRPSDPEMTRRLIDHARTKLNDLVMRTTFIVGYPGETEEQFQHLLRFVEEQEFDHVGVFTYSPEPGTPAALLGDRVPAEVAEDRRGRLMEVQQAISYRKNRSLVGTQQEILIEAIGESEDEVGRSEPISVGRARRHAPEVDGLVFVPGAHSVGSMVTVTIEDAAPYDLWAAPVGQEPRKRVQVLTKNRVTPKIRARRANRPERRGQGQPVHLAIRAETSPIGPGSSR